MRNPILLSLVLSLWCAQAFTQVTITVDDLANDGDKIYVSTALPTGEFELGVTGDDMLWDYSWLSPVAQDSSVWVDPIETNAAYFFLWFGSNVAEETGQTFESDFFSLEDIYNFYDRSEADLSITGIAGTITGIPLPAVFDDPDVIYDLPLSYGNEYSSSSGFTFSIPGIGSWQESRERTCTVDGWGSITTPYGTFNALRVYCELLVDDVFEYSGIEFPFSYIAREYRWLAPDQLIPVLQINTQEILGIEAVVSATYIDTLMSDPLGISGTNGLLDVRLLSNLVSDHQLQLQYSSTDVQEWEVFVIDQAGKIWNHTNLRTSTNEQTANVTLDQIPAGMYHLVIRDSRGAVKSLPFVCIP